MATTHATRFNWKTWAVIFLLLALIFVKGLMAFFLVGDRGQPDWDYRTLFDVPSSSPYAVYKLLPHTQHVRGAGGN